VRRYVIFTYLLLVVNTNYAQNDSLIFSNGTMMVGEIKNMNRGVLTIETDYSDSDFQIEWAHVSEIYSTREYIVSLDNGKRLTTKIITDQADKTKLLLNQNGTKLIIPTGHIVYIKPLEKRFIDKLNASLDLGYSLTKANNLRQFSMRSNVGYLTDNWSTDASFDAVSSEQDSIAATQRTEGNIGYNYFIGNNWYTLFSVNFLQNTEQKLKLRSTPKIGMGNYIIQTNAIYWGLFGGAAWNIESFTEADEPDRKSAEAYIGSELNMFDMGDLNLLTKISVYKGITESERWRADFKIDFKYDLPLDFYIKLGYTHNYDNRPIEGAAGTDYVFQTTFGWEL